MPRCISGGSAGLGKAIGLGGRRDKLRQAQAEATALSGHPAYAFPVDVGDPVAIEAAVDQIRWGGLVMQPVLVTLKMLLTRICG